MKHKGTKNLAILLTLAMVVGLMPGMGLTALAYEGDPYASLLNTTTVVNFDGKEWYLIENNSTAANAGNVTLLSKECVAASEYSTDMSNTYSGSAVEATVNNYYTNSISDTVKSAVVGGGMFLLTKEQTNAMTSDTRKCSQRSGADDNAWWLCSPGNNAFEAAYVDGEYGVVYDAGLARSVEYTLGVRPALKLNLESVIFSSVNLSGGANATRSGDSSIKNTFFLENDTVPAMTTITYTASAGYKFPAESSSYGTTNGITVTRTSDTVITVSGTPSGVANVTVPDAVQSSIAVTGINLDKTTAQTIDVDGKVSFTATVSPDNATDKKVKWSVGGTDTGAVKLYSNEACTTEVGADATEMLTVYAKGISAGSATVNVTSNADSSKTASCAVTVSNPTIAINPGVRNSTYDNGVYKVTYDGNPYSVIVNVTTPASGATVKYGTASETCTLDASPTITDVAESPLTVYYRVTAEGYSEYLGWATVEISKAEQTAPAAPTAASVSTNSVTLSSVDGCEYSMDGTNWQDSPSFTDLTMNTGYTFYQRRVGDANHNASPASAGAPISTSSHAHNWSYEASGATVTATCANTDGGHEGSTTATLTINATGSTYTGSAYAGASLDATAWTAAGLAAPTIEYAGRGSTSYTKSTTAPTDAGDYTASVTVEGQTASMDFTIGKADPGTPTVTMSGYTYGGAVSTPSIGTYSGGGTVTYYYNTSNSTTGGTEWTGITATSLNANTYYMYAVIAPTNNFNGYTTAAADFSIAKATVTVTAEAKSKTYGEADPALTYSASGLVGSDTLTGALTRASGENAGTYDITQGSLSAGENYTISFTGASFTINKAAITITADDKSSRYGDETAALTYTVGGAYKAGDELNVTLNTAASPTANVGEYEITVAYNNANYDATLVEGKYTVTKTGLTVTAAGYTGSYDGAAHGITVDVGSSGATVYYAATELTAENYATAGSTTAPTYTDAGEYTVYFYVVSGNYDPDTISGSKTVSISKATGTATDAQKPTAKTDLVADNTDQALVTAPAALPEGYTKVQYNIDNGTTWTDDVPTGRDAGSYTVNYKYVGDSNHNDFPGEPFTVTIKSLTVSFAGSDLAAQSVIKNGKLEQPADPTREGYAFDGWFEDATCTVPYDFNETVTDNVTLYAKWTPNVYQMTAVIGATTDANHIWYKQSGTDTVTNNNTGVEITVKLTNGPDDSFDHFNGVQLDGVTLTRDVDYAARAGSTVVTLFPATLRRLSNGAHTVTVLFDNNSEGVSTRLTVRQNSSTPATGDESNTALWITVLTLSALGMAAVTVNTKKRRTAKR